MTESTPTTTTPETTPDTKNKPRKRRGRRIAFVILALFILLIAAVGYLQSSFAIRHHYLPIASEKLGMQITADSADLKLFGGGLELNNLQVADAQGEPALTLKQLSAAVALGSLLNKPLPTVDYVRVEGLAVHSRIDANGKHNLALPASTSAAQQTAETQTPAKTKADSPASYLPPSLSIKEVSLKDITLDHRDARNGQQIDFVLEAFTLKGLLPGETGSWTFAGNGQSRSEAAAGGALKIQGEGSLLQAADGEKLEANHTLELEFEPETKSMVKDTPARLELQGHHAVEKNGKSLHRIELALETLTESGGTGVALGQIDAEVETAAGMDLQRAQSSIKGITNESVNAILAMLAQPARTTKGQLEANAFINKEADTYEATVTLNAPGWRVRTVPDAAASPALDLTLLHEAQWQPATRALMVKALDVDLRQQGDSLLSTALSAPLEVKMSDPPQVSEAQLALSLPGLRWEQIEPWAALLGMKDALPFNAGTFKADLRCGFSQADASVQLKGTIDATKLTLAQASTLPTDLSFELDGSYALADARCQLATLKADAALKGEKTFSLALERPLAFRSAAAGAALPIALEAPARLHLVWQPTSIARLRMIAQALGVAWPAEIESGETSAQLTLALSDTGPLATLEGYSLLKNLQLASARKTPLDVRKDVSLTLSQALVCEISKHQTTLSTGNETLAQLGIDGKLDIASMNGNLNLQTRTDDLARVIGIFAPQVAEAGTLKGGQLVAQQSIKLASASQVSLDGELNAKGLILSIAEGQSVPCQLEHHMAIQADLDQSQLTIKQNQFSISSPQNKSITGSISTPGKIGWDPANPVADLTLKIQALELAPWMQALKPECRGAFTTCRLDGEQQLKQSGGQAFSTNGAFTLSTDGTVPFALDAKLSANGTPQQLDAINLTLDGNATQGAPDQLTLTGKGKLQPAPDLDLKAHIVSWKLDPYLKPFEQCETPEIEEVSMGDDRSPTPAPPVDAPQADAPASSAAVTVALTIDDARYKELQWQNVTGTATWRDNVGSLQLDQSTLNGGSITGKGMVQLLGPEPQYQWNFKFANVPVQPMAKSFAPEWAPLAEGLLNLTTEGKGMGTGREALRKLTAKADFGMKDGRLRDLPILNAISELTDVERFKDIPIRDLQGLIDIVEGRIGIDRLDLISDELSMGLKGKLGIDGSYQLALAPWLEPAVIKNGKYDKYLSLLPKNEQGFARFPLDIDMIGSKQGYRLKTKLNVAEQASDALKNPEAIGGLLEGVLNKELEKRKDKEEKKSQTEGKATDETVPEATPTPTPEGEANTTEKQAELEKKKKPEEQLEEAVGGLLEGLLK